VSSPTATSSATTYRARRRPGLTIAGVAVLSAATGLVAGVIATLVSGGLGWIFGVPFVLAAGYCAWEVREADRLASVIAPPLTLLAVTVIASLTSGWAGITHLALAVVTSLINAAPMLVTAELVVGAVLLSRRLRTKS